MKIQTHEGHIFDYENLDKNIYDINDIAYSLSRICRFNGHVNQLSFYSVAEHCYWCSIIAPEGLKLACLLHDAAECYVGDVMRPYKHFLSNKIGHEYAKIEPSIQKNINSYFELNLTAIDDLNVAEIDNIMLATEYGKCMYRRHDFDWDLPYQTCEIEPIGFSPEIMTTLFLNRFKGLRIGYIN